MAIQDLIATHYQRNAGPSALETMSGMEALKGQQLRNQAGTEAIAQGNANKGMQFAANVAAQIKKTEDPAQKAEIYATALELGKRNGFDTSPYPASYDANAQQILDVVYAQVYEPKLFEQQMLKYKQMATAKPFAPVPMQDESGKYSGMGIPVYDPVTGSATYKPISGGNAMNPVDLAGAKSSATQGAALRQDLIYKPQIAGDVAQTEADVALKTKPDIERKVAGAKVEGKSAAESAVGLPQTIATSEYTMSVLDQMLNHPGLDAATGASSRADPRNFIPGTDAYNFNVLKDQVQGQTFLQAFESLKGAGQITEVEGNKATNAIARLNTAQSKEEFVKAVDEFKGVISRGLERARAKAAKAGPQAAQQPQQPAGGQDEDSAALEWARSNPNDPRAQQIMQMLGGQ